MSPRSPNPETAAIERAERSQRLPHDQDRSPKPPPRPDAGGKPNGGTQGARPRDGL